MTLALSTDPPPPAPLDPLADLDARVTDWRDPGAVARAAVSVMRAAAPKAIVTVYRYDAASEVLVLLASQPADRDGAAVGTRLLLGEGVLADAVREGEIRRAINSYVRPDFVRSLPGETRSELALPIRTGAVVHGAIYLEYPSNHRPSADEETAAVSLAIHLGAAFAAGPGLVPDAAPDASDSRLARAEALSVLASHLAQNADLRGVLERVADTALRLVPGEGAVVLLRHESRQMLEVGAAVGAELAVEGELIALDRTLPGQVARDGQPRVCESLTEDDRFSPLDRERGIRDALLVPLSAAGKTYGVLAVLNRRSGSFGAEDVDTLQSLANQAAAIEAMRSLGPLRQRLSDSSLLAEVGRAVTGTLGLDEVLAVVVRAAEMMVSSARCAAVALLDEHGQSLTLAATSGSLLTRMGDTIPVHGSVTGWAVLGSETITSSCIGEDPRRDEGEAKLGAGVIIPIESGTRVHGALLTARAPHAEVPSDEDVDALRKLAAYAAIAIENARLYREQTELSQKLRAKTDELESAYAELRDSQERLLVSEKMAALGRVTAGLAHEINSPLGGILNCLQMAQTYVTEYRASIDDPDVTREDHEAIATDLTESLTLAEASTRKVAQFVRTIKGQTRAGEEEMRVEFEPADEVDGVLVVLQHEARSRQVKLSSELTRDVQLVGDPGKFSLLVQNLLKNAIDAYVGTEGEVWVRWSRLPDGRPRLTVEDRGCGIPESIRGRIYDYLFTTKDIGQGTGLGLSTVHSIVTSHFEGEVDFESTEGEGTTFHVTFPPSPREGLIMARKYSSVTRATGYTILVIDDSTEILESSRRLLEAEGHRVITAPDGPSGLTLLDQERVHLILCDYFMPEMTGEEVVRRVRDRNRLVQIILVTGYSGEKPARVMMRELDIQGYHDKGEGADRLLLWVDAALKSYRHVMAMEKHRTGLRFILDITPELHRVQPMDELLRGLLWQVEGLLGAENSFLATFCPDAPPTEAAAVGEGFVALVDGGGSAELEIRFGTGRYHSGLVFQSIEDLDPAVVKRAIDTGTVQILDNASVVPLMLGKRPLGVIYLDRRTGHSRDEELLEVFASQAAAAIQNSLLYDMATTDSLTGTYVRGFVIQQLQQSIKRTLRHTEPLSLLMVDVDRFKQVNDQYGHQIGDRALRLVGEVLRDAVRETDVVGRYGGDEFMIILPGTAAAGALIVANRILQRAANTAIPVDDEAGSVPLQLSLGIATLHPPTPESHPAVDPDSVECAADSLIASADRALYAAKGHGRADEPQPLAWEELLVATE